MKNSDFDRARELKMRARARRSQEDLEAAYSNVSEAIQILEATSGEGTMPVELFHSELADLYGMQGGILRRLGNEDAALRSFEGGRIYASLSKAGVDYNHTQAVLLLWLGSDHSRDDLELRMKLPSAIRVLGRSLIGSRMRDPWAWADHGILCLLDGRYKEADASFLQYQRIGDQHLSNTAICSMLAKIWVEATDFNLELSSNTERIFVALGGDPQILVPRGRFYSCFISYSSRDEDFARHLHADLKKSRVMCWFAPEDMKIGDRVRPTVEGAIRLHDKLVLILSQRSIDSDWVEHEVSQALEREAVGGEPVLFPIRIDDAIFQAKFGWARKIREAHRPTGRHIGDFTHWQVPAAYRKSIQRLLRDLKSTTAPR